MHVLKKGKDKTEVIGAIEAAEAIVPVQDALDAFANAELEQATMLLLWQNRFNNPEMAVKVTEQDLTAFWASMDYLDKEPRIQVIRPQGRPAIPPVQGKHEGYPAEPPRDYVFVQLVDKDGNSIKPIENNQADFDKARLSEQQRQAKADLPRLAAAVKGQAQVGEFSSSSIIELADAALLLAR